MSDAKKEWMVGLPGHKEVVALDQVLLLIRGGQIRETDLLKRLGEPWHAAGEISELAPVFKEKNSPASAPAPAESSPPAQGPPAPGESSEPPKGTRKLGRPTRLRPLQRIRPGARTPSPEAEPEQTSPEPAPPPPPPRAEVAAPAVTEAAPGPSPRAPESTERPGPPKSPSETPTAPPLVKQPPARRAPVPAPASALAPMDSKYFSPTDLMRAITYAFAPKKLLVAAVFLIPTMIVAALLLHGVTRYAGEDHRILGRLLLGIIATFVAYGVVFSTLILAYMTRLQIEGRAASTGELVSYGIRNLASAATYPLAGLVPALVFIALMAVVGWVRNMSDGMAAVLRVAYFIPLLLGFLIVLSGLVIQIATMYFSASLAVEGGGLKQAMKSATHYFRTQTGRVLFHWLLISILVVFAYEVISRLIWMAHDAPEYFFPATDAELPSWTGMRGMQAFYLGLCAGLALILPASLFATMSVLSFLVIKQEDIVYTTPDEPSDTSGGASGTTGPPPADPILTETKAEGAEEPPAGESPEKQA